MEKPNDITTHGLAEMLESVALRLRSLPDQALPAEEPATTKPSKKRVHSARSNNGGSAQNLEAVAQAIQEMSRQDAEENLAALKVAEIRQVGAILGVRIGSKAPKQEAVRTLTWHLFDSKSGHELISTYHRRRATT